MSAATPDNAGSAERKGPGRPRRTDWQDRFLEHYRSCGVQAYAAKSSAISADTVERERKRNPDFAAAYDEAFEESTAALEFSAYRWATVGLPTETTVVRERREANEKGEMVVTMRETTTTKTVDRHASLSIFMLKSRRPEVYRDRLALEGSGKDGAPIVLEVTKEERDTAVERFGSTVASLAAARAARAGAQGGGES